MGLRLVMVFRKLQPIEWVRQKGTVTIFKIMILKLWKFLKFEMILGLDSMKWLDQIKISVESIRLVESILIVESILRFDQLLIFHLHDQRILSYPHYQRILRYSHNQQILRYPHYQKILSFTHYQRILRYSHYQRNFQRKMKKCIKRRWTWNQNLLCQIHQIYFHQIQEQRKRKANIRNASWTNVGKKVIVQKTIATMTMTLKYTHLWHECLMMM